MDRNKSPIVRNVLKMKSYKYDSDPNAFHMCIIYIVNTLQENTVFHVCVYIHTLEYITFFSNGPNYGIHIYFLKLILRIINFIINIPLAGRQCQKLNLSITKGPQWHFTGS